MINWNEYSVGSHRISCPHCKKNQKDKSAGLTIYPDQSGVMHCFRCDFTESVKGNHSSVHHIGVQKPSSDVPVKRTTLSDWGWTFWNACVPISGIAADYLNIRKCAIPPVDGHLRWHPKVKHRSGYEGPALVALVTDAESGDPISLHRTWITSTGKADVDPPRMQLAGHSLTNGVIRLWTDDFVTHGLGVAEGIETALSLAHAYEPVWSLIDANHLANFPVLNGIEYLVIARDNDPAGRKAAEKCAKRWFTQGCRVMITNQAANDLNDLLGEAA